ncbi:endospore germination permease [Paenactinomyces guangxiensis]|uniref:Endospore germination permease n=1 Tax=Paenactinomyces guangxiensis TaxID=1490290 RepID=A0A7W1WRK7_9BACL|nr:endospore germination permease [Paenactinomyces guangxiensis]MBA4494766.1 endospore germination permease [Paenactinomyces guangxiensis]MBH8591850.1 endospore germination permease [Paenactinomyces guangxiensis]
MAKFHQSSKETISSYQAFALIHSTMFGGVGILTLPRDVSEAAGENGIYTVLISGLIIIGVTYIISRLISRFPRETLVQFVPEILGSSKKSKLGQVLSIPFVLVPALLWLISICSVARLFAEALHTAALTQTPIEVIILSLVAVSAIAAGANPVVVARLNELFFPLKFFTVFFLITALLTRGEVTNLLPLFQVDWKSVLHAVIVSAFAYSGYETIFIFGGYYQKPKQTFTVLSLAVASITIVYWLSFIAVNSVFGVEEVKRLTWPGIELIKVIENPGIVLERMESATLSIWAASVFVAMTNLFTALVQVFKHFFAMKEKTTRRIPWLFLPVTYVIAMYPDSVQDVFRYTGWVGLFGFATSLLIPGILLLIAVIRKKRGADSCETTSAS